MSSDIETSARLGGAAALLGALTMLAGAGLWASSGTDLWAALDNGDIASYLTAASAARSLLVANLSLWIGGVLILSVAGAALVALCSRRPVWAQLADVCFRTAVPLAIVSFIAMLSLVVQIGPDASATSLRIAEVVGWIGVRADDLATALIVGFGPLFISLAGRRDWAPNWLVYWGYLAGAIGLFSLVVLYLPSLSSYGILIVPVGIGWMLAVGILLLRRGPAAQQQPAG